MATLGRQLYGSWNIIPSATVTIATDTEIAAGEVVAFPSVASPILYAVVPHDVAATGATSSGHMMGHYNVRKKAGAAHTLHAYLKFTVVAGHDYYEAQPATNGDEVHAICMTAAALAATEVHILGPFYPPFSFMGQTSLLLTLPDAIGTEDQILKVNGSGAIAWASDAGS